MAIRSILALFLVLAPGTAAGGLPSTGMLLDGVGTPEKSTDRMEGRLKVTSRVSPAGEGRLTAEFVEGVLIRYTMTSN